MDYFFLCVSVFSSTSLQWTRVSFEFGAFEAYNDDITLPYVAKIMVIRDLVKSVFSLHCCFFFCWIFHMPRQS